jgi:hypothetical protein
MKDALKRQVGGSHYQSSGVQHAQFCQANRIPWCESSALKYLTRHRRKNGRQDLEKAKHYLEICCHEDYLVRNANPVGMYPKNFMIPLATFLKDNAVPAAEAEIMKLIVSHQEVHGESTLLNAIRKIDTLIKHYDDETLGADLLF